MLSTDDLVAALSRSIDSRLAKALVAEADSIEEAFQLRRWKYTELDGGRFAEVAARIVYSVDSGNLSLTKSVDDCLKYIENNQVTHHFPEPQAAIHLDKAIRAIYKLRSQRGAVHVSSTYTANEIDSRYILESVHWVFAEIIRLFVSSDPNAVAEIIRSLARFPQPLIRQYGDQPLLQAISFTAEEELLAHLMYSEAGLSIGELIAAIPRDQSTVRRAASKLAGSKFRQVVLRDGKWLITDLGISRIELKIAEASKS